MFKPRKQKIYRQNGLTDSTVVKLNYTDRFLAQVPANTMWEHDWYGNYPYDPDPALLNYSANGYNYWSRLYRYVTCLGSKMKVTITGHDINAPSWGYLVLGSGLNTVVPNQSIPITLEGVAANPHIFRYKKWWNGMPSIKPCFLSMKSSTQKVYGTKYSPAIDQAMTSGVGNNPERIWMWYVGIRNELTGGANSNFEMIVNITYYCKFHGREIQAAGYDDPDGPDDDVNPLAPGLHNLDGSDAIAFPVIGPQGITYGTPFPVYQPGDDGGTQGPQGFQGYQGSLPPPS